MAIVKRSADNPDAVKLAELPLRERTQRVLGNFDKANTQDGFYLLTDGGDSLTYAELMADLLEEWLSGEVGAQDIRTADPADLQVVHDDDGTSCGSTPVFFGGEPRCAAHRRVVRQEPKP